MPEAKAWNLVADIGGTNARFALHYSRSDQLLHIITLSVAGYPAFTDALRHYLSHIQQLDEWLPLPEAACLAVACPVDREIIRFTNSNWQFSRTELAQVVGDIPLDVINDFSAVAYCITQLSADQWHQIGGGSSQQHKPIAILGPGTGLGVCTLLPLDSGYVVVDGEGGHIDFAPVDGRELAILKVLQQRYQRVSVERLLSGSGIVNIYQALCALESVSVTQHSAQHITQAALEGGDSLSYEALSIFCRVLGSTASNLALISGAKGGVYIAGGIVPRFLEFVENSDFRHRFEDKGRFKSYVEAIPVRVLLKSNPGLYGAMQKIKLNQQ